MRNYCTLFDRNYLLFGLALLDSLREHESNEFILYILAMDKISEDILIKMSLPGVEIISLEKIINKELEWIYGEMTFGQICWTSQPLLCRYVLSNFEVNHVVYLEADSFFFSSPDELFREIGHRSVSLVPHNYAKQYDQTNSSGIYCVQFNYFSNNSVGNNFLDMWTHECLKYSKKRTGYYPGQICMNEWPVISSEVCVIENIGAGVAPWNSIKYKIEPLKEGLPKVNNVPVIFFHFHELAYIGKTKILLSTYSLSEEVKEFIYAKYLKKLSILEELINNYSRSFNFKKYLLAPKFIFVKSLYSYSYYRQLLKYIVILIRGRKNIIYRNR